MLDIVDGVEIFEEFCELYEVVVLNGGGIYAYTCLEIEQSKLCSIENDTDYDWIVVEDNESDKFKLTLTNGVKCFTLLVNSQTK